MTTTYNIWVRLEVPSTSSTSPLLLNVNNATGNNCYGVDGSSVSTANTLTWVNVTSGLSSLPTFSQGNATLLVTGTVSGTSLDAVEFLNDSSCTPTGDGTNCTTSAPLPTVSLTASPTTINSGASSTLSWTSTNATSCSATSPSNWTGSTATSGSQSVSPTTTTTTYSISCTGTGAAGSTSATATVTVNSQPTCTTNTLAAPTNLAESSSSYTTIGVTWTAPSPTPGCTITGYKVFRNGTQVGSPASASFTDTGLTASTSYSYTVEATDSGSNVSAQSAAGSFGTVADNQAPNAPTGLSATAPSAGQVNLSWSASTDNPSPGGVGVAGYNVYRCTGASCTPSTTTPLNGGSLISGNSYSDTTVSASTSYGYVVTAVDRVANESAPSSTARATTPAPTCSGNPSQPGKPNAGTTTDQSVSFSWTASTASAGCSLSGYHIYQVNGSTYTFVTTVTSGTTANISSLTPNTSYTYAAEAFDTDGHTSDRTQANAQITIATRPDTTLPTAPASLTATAVSSNQVSLSWPAGSDDVGVASYKLYRCSGAGCSNFTALNGGSVTATSATNYTYADTTAAANTSYTYQVSSIDEAGNESSPKTTSNSVTTPVASGTAPSAPTSPTAPTVSTQSAILSWNAPSAGGTPTGYHVYIDGVLDTYGPDSFTATGGTLNCLAPDVTYTVTVKAFNSAGEGPAATVSVPTTSGGLAGDFNCDSAVNGFDLNALASDWLRASMEPFQGDANGDASVNGFDLNALASNWGKSI